MLSLKKWFLEVSRREARLASLTGAILACWSCTGLLALSFLALLGVTGVTAFTILERIDVLSGITGQIVLFLSLLLLVLGVRRAGVVPLGGTLAGSVLVALGYFILPHGVVHHIAEGLPHFTGIPSEVVPGLVSFWAGGLVLLASFGYPAFKRSRLTSGNFQG